MIYGHSQNLAAALPLIKRQRPAYWLAIDPDMPSIVACHDLGVKLLVRHAGPWDAGSPERMISPAEFVAQCSAQPWFPQSWAVLSPNEPNDGNAGWMSECVVRFRALGKQCVVGNWANGHDGFYVPGATLYGCHGYGDPRQPEPLMWNAPDLALRYRRWWPAVLKAAPQARLFITEFGLTQAAIAGQGDDVGWLAPGGPSGWDYRESIARYAAELERDSVLGAFLFEAGALPPWENFEVLGSSVAEWMATQAVAHPSAPQGHPGSHGGKGTVADFVIGQGIRDKAAALGVAVTGQPLCDETYLKDGTGRDTYSYVVYEKCEIRYYPALNRVAAIPFLA